MSPGGNSRVLAAPILGERGGGVGRVSELLWHVLRDEWGGRAEVVTLLRNGHDAPGLADKWRFGLELAGKQLLQHADWILFSHLGLARVERYLPARWGRPYAVFLHGIECWSPLADADKDVLRRASLRLANSTYTARRASEANPGLGEIAVCPLALPPSATVRFASDGEKASARTALVVGRVSSTERYKGHEQLIRAWPSVERLAPGARLVIAGDGDDLPRLRALASEVSPSAIEFTGYLSRPALERRYAEATVFALPSRGEGFGVVYLEAMAAGLPCIGSIHDAACEVIVDGETGRLVNPDDPELLAIAIASFLNEPRRAREMGEAGRTRLLSTFSYEQFRDRVTRLLAGALTGAGAQGR